MIVAEYLVNKPIATKIAKMVYESMESHAKSSGKGSMWNVFFMKPTNP